MNDFMEGLTVTYWKDSYDSDLWFFTFECEKEKIWAIGSVWSMIYSCQLC